jgi:tRNA(Ile2) C34 agmatinyltransferase TiaS
VQQACVECGRVFEAKGKWQLRCWTCWRSYKESQEREGLDAAYNDGYRDGYRDGRRALVLSADLVRDLVQLCHPDRHPPERAELANRTTAALLDLRDRYA